MGLQRRRARPVDKGAAEMEDYDVDKMESPPKNEKAPPSKSLVDAYLSSKAYEGRSGQKDKRRVPASKPAKKGRGRD